MNNNTKKPQQKSTSIPNPLEAIKEVGQQTAAQMREEIRDLPKNLVDELLGIKQPGKNYSGEITPGASLEMNEVLSGRHQEEIVTRQKISLERGLLQEERAQSERKTNELKMQLHAIQQELIKIAQNTETLAVETEIAAKMTAIDPGIYHVVFFEKLLEFIKSFRKKIGEAGVWLHSVNARASKKNAWGNNYKKHGAKYLLSGEHYVARSAG